MNSTTKNNMLCNVMMHGIRMQMFSRTLRNKILLNHKTVTNLISIKNLSSTLFRAYKENKTKVKAEKAGSGLPWPLPLRAHVVVDASFFMELFGELQYFLFSGMELSLEGVHFFFQSNSGLL